MSSSIAVTYKVQTTVVETLGTNVPAASVKEVTHTLFNTTKTLNGASTPPVTLHAAFEKALSGGAATIDLTALVGTNNLAVDGTGLRVQVLRVRNPATNANPITIGKGASNGYAGLGASFSLALAAGAEAVILGNDAGSDIGSGNKTLDLAGTGSQALQVEIVLG